MRGKLSFCMMEIKAPILWSGRSTSKKVNVRDPTCILKLYFQSKVNKRTCRGQVNTDWPTTI